MRLIRTYSYICDTRHTFSLFLNLGKCETSKASTNQCLPPLKLRWTGLPFVLSRLTKKPTWAR